MAYVQSPTAHLDYFSNWGQELAVTGDAIADYTITVDPAGLTVADDELVAGRDSDGGIVPAGGVVMWVSGGTLGEQYEVKLHIISAEGREDDDTITFRIVKT